MKEYLAERREQVLREIADCNDPNKLFRLTGRLGELDWLVGLEDFAESETQTIKELEKLSHRD